MRIIILKEEQDPIENDDNWRNGDELTKKYTKANAHSKDSSTGI